MMITHRTTVDHPDFQQLVEELNQDLKVRDGQQHLFYAELNRADDISHVIMAYNDVLPIGCGAIRVHDREAMEIKRMFVKPGNRNRGIASFILQELESWARELGYRHCVLETGRNQPEAIGLYRKKGYVMIPNFGKYMDSENSICFRKTL